MRGLGGEQTTGIRINVFESFLQMHGGRTIEFVQYFVMRSLGQSHVEIDIGRDTVVQSSGCGGRTAPGEVWKSCSTRYRPKCTAYVAARPVRQWRPPESAGPPPDRRCRHVACTAPSTRSVPSGFRRTSRPPAALSATPCWPRSSRLRAPSNGRPRKFSSIRIRSATSVPARSAPATGRPSLRPTIFFESSYPYSLSSHHLMFVQK